MSISNSGTEFMNMILKCPLPNIDDKVQNCPSADREINTAWLRFFPRILDLYQSSKLDFFSGCSRTTVGFSLNHSVEGEDIWAWRFFQAGLYDQIRDLKSDLRLLIHCRS